MAETGRPTLAGRAYVVLDEDAEDIAEARRVVARVAAGEEEMIPGEIVERLAGGESRIRVWRQHRGLTIKALAARAGISRATLSQIETGKRDGKLATISAIARALDLDLDDLAPVEAEGGESAQGAAGAVGAERRRSVITGAPVTRPPAFRDLSPEPSYAARLVGNESVVGL